MKLTDLYKISRCIWMRSGLLMKLICSWGFFTVPSCLSASELFYYCCFWASDCSGTF